VFAGAFGAVALLGLAVSSSAVAKTPPNQTLLGRKLSVATALVGGRDGGGEPSIATGPHGYLYVSWPGSNMNFARSTDGGKTWTAGGQPQVDSTGDTSVNVDSSGAVYETDLHVIETSDKTLQADVFKSKDHGTTWTLRGSSVLEPDNTTGNPFFVDRQWVDAYIPPGKTTNDAIVGLEYHDFGPSAVWVSVSKDGGKTYALPVDVVNDPVAIADTYCNSIPGGLKIVPNGLPHAGRMYVSWLGADPANAATGCNETQLAAFHSVWTAYSDDQGATWTDHLVFDPGPLHDGSEIFPDITLDNQGNPYVAFAMNLTTEFDMYVEQSLDGGNTWNGKTDGTGAPYKVNSSTGTHYFPAIGVGNPGQVDVAYIATDTVVASDPNGKPMPGGDNSAVWNVYLAQTRNLGSRAFKNILVSPLPIHTGDVCTLGLFCAAVPNANRDILDFIDLAVDHAGLAHVVYTAADGTMADGIYAGNQNGGPTVGRGGH
jgi:hypothetical protein